LINFRELIDFHPPRNQNCCRQVDLVQTQLAQLLNLLGPLIVEEIIFHLYQNQFKLLCFLLFASLYSELVFSHAEVECYAFEAEQIQGFLRRHLGGFLYLQNLANVWVFSLILMIRKRLVLAKFLMASLKTLDLISSSI
jgi:hypothetical protein